MNTKHILSRLTGGVADNYGVLYLTVPSEMGRRLGRILKHADCFFAFGPKPPPGCDFSDEKQAADSLCRWASSRRINNGEL